MHVKRHPHWRGPPRPCGNAQRVHPAVRLRFCDPWVTRREDGGLLAVSGPDMVVLRTSVRLRSEDFKTIGDFIVCSSTAWRQSGTSPMKESGKCAAIVDNMSAKCNSASLAKSWRLVGNFPQALSHVALVNTANTLTRSEKPTQHRSEASSH